MESLRWSASGSGWSSDRYRIERAIPRLFALLDTTGRHESLIQFSPSVAWLKHVARRQETSRLRRMMLVRHVTHMAFFAALVRLSITLAPVLIFPTALIAATAALRSLVWWMDTARGSPWSRVRETYQ